MLSHPVVGVMMRMHGVGIDEGEVDVMWSNCPFSLCERAGARNQISRGLLCPCTGSVANFVLT
jgi:hypothetical protein